MADRPILEDVVRRAYDAHVRYWEAVGRATTDYVQTAIKIWADAPISWTPGVRATSPMGSAASPTASLEGHTAPKTVVAALLLEGIAGTQARAVVMVSNDLDRDAEAPIVISALRGPDGRFAPLEVRTVPERVKLAAAAKVPVTVSADITDDLVEGSDYHGEINVPGLSPVGVPLVVRRRAK